MKQILDVMNQAPASVKATMDIGAVSLAWVGFLTDFLPLVATSLSIIWFSLQIYVLIDKKWRGGK